MGNRSGLLQVIVGVLLLGFILLLGAFFIPWREVDWGKFQLVPARTISVVGEAETQQKTQIAHFTAGVSAVNDNKDTA